MNLVYFSRFLLLSLPLFIASFVAEANADPNFTLVSAPVKNICRQAEQGSPPVQDQPNSALLKTLTQCDAASLYYGLAPGRQPDYTAARQCAFATQNKGVLTMIYANGDGVQKNLNLAIHFACQAGFAPAEIEGRVMHLVALRDHPEKAGHFDICDDVTSGFMTGVCASYQEQLAQKQRQQQIAELTKNWSVSDRQALQRLQDAANDFIKTHAANEVDLSGTARAATELQEQGALQDDLVSTLRDLAKGTFPDHTADQSTHADQQLNQVFQQIEKDTHFAEGTIDRQGVRKTQRAWLKYRDAWIEFGKAKYPQVSTDSWKTWITQKRTEMLQDLNN
jgi:uncharacterized protein YecT (DUF1311 family)